MAMSAVNWLDFVRCCRRREAAFGSQFGGTSVRRGRVPSTGSEDVMLCEGMHCRAMPYDQDMVPHDVNNPLLRFPASDSHPMDPDGFRDGSRDPRAVRGAMTYMDGNGFKPDANYKYVGHGVGNSAGQLHVVPHQPHHGCRILVCAFFSVLAVSLSGSLFYVGRYFIDPDGTQFWRQKPEPVRRRHSNEASVENGAIDCSGSVSSWSEVQRVACCERRGVGCQQGEEDSPLRCNGHVAAWSEARRAACCEREGVGCSTDSGTQASKDGDLDCHGSTASWSESKRTACCTRKGIGCRTDQQDQDTFDCMEHPGKTSQGWTIAQQDWCCVHKQVRCQRSATAPSTSSAQHFDCQGSSSSWGTEEKVYCCVNLQMGCAEDGAGASTSPAAKSDSAATCDSVCEADGESRTCKQRLDDAVLHLFVGRSNACSLASQKVGVQCPRCSSCSPGEHLCKEQQSAPPSKADSKSQPFDCIAGYAHWQTKWSDAKKAWCCTRGGLQLGCPDVLSKRSAAPAPSTSAQPISGTTFFLPFDCLAGYANWATDWSTKKKTWCCRHTQRGCEHPAETPAKEDDEKDEKKDAEPEAQDNNGKPFDCTAGYVDWEAKWSLIKKAWCCQHKQRGCPPRMTSVPYNCNAQLSHWKSRWSTAKREWCCRNTGKGCETHGRADFDCVAGYSKWESLWSDEKKKFCCARVDCHSTE